MEEIFKQSPPRPITTGEAAKLKKVLYGNHTPEDLDIYVDKTHPLFYVDQVDNLTVMEECPCGCESIYFKTVGDGKEVPVGGQTCIADNLESFTDSDTSEMIFVHVYNGELCEMEIV